jgi:hypothetical protein
MLYMRRRSTQRTWKRNYAKHPDAIWTVDDLTTLPYNPHCTTLGAQRKCHSAGWTKARPTNPNATKYELNQSWHPSFNFIFSVSQPVRDAQFGFCPVVWFELTTQVQHTIPTFKPHHLSKLISSYHEALAYPDWPASCVAYPWSTYNRLLSCLSGCFYVDLV